MGDLMLRRRKYQVLYPEYFSADVSRKQGRRVSKIKATKDMDLRKLVYACKKLDVPHQIQQDKSFPRFNWDNGGRVLITIDKKDKKIKQQLVHEIADITRRIVSKKAPEDKKSDAKLYTKSTHSKKRQIIADKQKKDKKKKKKRSSHN